MKDAVELTTVVGNYANTAALKDGRVGSPRLALRHIDFNPVTNAFAQMVEDQRFDVCEMALATYLQAVDAGVPITLLPIVLVGQFPHRFLVHREGGPVNSPQDLVGARIGVRAYSVTTGMWVRGILSEQYGLDLGTMKWLTFEQPHVRSYVSPSNVKLAPEGATIDSLLRTGDLDAAIGGGPLIADAAFRPTLGDPNAAAKEWYEARKIVPINHMLTVRTELVEQVPKIVPELIRMFADAKSLAEPKPTLERALGADPTPIDRPGIEKPLSLAIDLAKEQGLISRTFRSDELFAPAVQHTA